MTRSDALRIPVADADAAAGPGSATAARHRSTCPYCGVGCGVTIESDGEKTTVSGDGAHPANRGRLCVKGTRLADTLVPRGRLLTPRLRDAPCDWDKALKEMATALRRTLADHGPDSVAFYLSGQLLTEDYYVANKLMKGFLGSANVDTNSRLCMASAVAAQKRAFGADFVPCSYSDLDDCDLLVMVGSNAAWTHPVLYRQIAASRRANPDKRIVLIDPRRTASADTADLHLPLRPGSDGHLFAGLLKYLADNGCVDTQWVDAHVSHWQASIAAVSGLTTARVARETGLSEDSLLRFYRLFAEHERVVTFFSQGINQSATGTDKANLIINCHLATGRIGRAGAGPFSITGQPNAMGGREVGGLANQLAAHMDFTPEAVDRVGRFWRAPAMATAPGLKAVDLFAAMSRGDIRFLWIMATNPAVSLPDSEHVRQALNRCATVVVSDCIANTDTAQYADILLPAAGWGEKDGTVTNSERVISRQRAFRAPAGDARPDWRIVCDLADRLGFGGAFSFASPADIFREHAALSAFENGGSRDFDIGALSRLTDDEYATMTPRRWPLPETGTPCPRLPAFHPDGRMHMLPITPEAQPRERPERDSDTVFRLLLNTGRLRDQWHTMTRTGLSPSLNRHRRFFAASLHADTAQALALAEGDLLRVANDGGECLAVCSIDAGIAPGSVFLPIHWSDQFAASCRVSSLLPPITDPVSGQPQSKYAWVTVEKIGVERWALILTRDPFATAEIQARYWSRISTTGGELLLAADPSLAGLREAIDHRYPDAELLSVAGQSPAMERRVWIDDVQVAALYAHEDHRKLPDPGLLERQFTRALPEPRWRLLTDPSPQSQAHALVCSCHDVTEQQIRDAIQAGQRSIDALGGALKCGTGCGSCLPELQGLIDEERDRRNEEDSTLLDGVAGR